MTFHLNLNPPHPRMLYAKFGWNLPSCSSEEDFFQNFVIFISFKVRLFLWTNLNSLHTRWFVPSLAEIISLVILVEFFSLILAISFLSPLGKRRGPSFGQTWILFTQECFVPSLVEISPVVRENFFFKFRYSQYTEMLSAMLGWTFKFCWCIFAITLLSPLGIVRGLTMLFIIKYKEK